MVLPPARLLPMLPMYMRGMLARIACSGGSLGEFSTLLPGSFGTKCARDDMKEEDEEDKEVEFWNKPSLSASSSSCCCCCCCCWRWLFESCCGDGNTAPPKSDDDAVE